jgi:hypothetical protein
VKILIIVTSGILALVVVVIIYFFHHTMVLERNSVVDFKATELQHDGVHIVRISGLCGHSSMSVRDISQKKLDSSIVVFVHIFLVRPGTTGYFQYDVAVPEGIKVIRFGNSEAVIWQRGQSDPDLN